MSKRLHPETLEQQLQVLDVQIVDVLSHLEALLRHSHSIQRLLLQVRSEAPPPRPAPTHAVCGELISHVTEMRRECDELEEIVDDVADGIRALQPSARDRSPAADTR